MTESTVLLIVANLYGDTILHLQYCHSQGVSGWTNGKNYSDIIFPVSLSEKPWSIIPVDWQGATPITSIPANGSVIYDDVTTTNKTKIYFAHTVEWFKVLLFGIM